MSIRLAATAGLFLTATSTAAMAQFTYSGEVSLGYYASDGDNNRVGIVDAEAEYLFEGNSFGLGVDVFAAVDSEGDLDDVNYFNLYAIYEADFGRFELGHTPSASELITANDRVGLHNFLQLQLDVITNPIMAAYLADRTVYGLNYYGDYDQMQVAASVHFVEDADGAVLAAAMTTQMTDTLYLNAGVEVLTDAASNQAPTYRIGAGYEANGIRVDALYTHHLQFREDTDLTELDVAYDIQQMAGLSLGASFVSLDFGSGANELYGLGAEYALDSGFGLAANAIFADGGDNQYAVELTFDF